MVRECVNGWEAERLTWGKWWRAWEAIEREILTGGWRTKRQETEGWDIKNKKLTEVIERKKKGQKTNTQRSRMVENVYTCSLQLDYLKGWFERSPKIELHWINFISTKNTLKFPVWCFQSLKKGQVWVFYPESDSQLGETSDRLTSQRPVRLHIDAVTETCNLTPCAHYFYFTTALFIVKEFPPGFLI